jgi:hypothetical protein
MVLRTEGPLPAKVIVDLLSGTALSMVLREGNPGGTFELLSYLMFIFPRVVAIEISELRTI